MNKVSGINIVVKWFVTQKNKTFTIGDFLEKIIFFDSEYCRLNEIDHKKFTPVTWDRYRRWAIEEVNNGDFDIEVTEVETVNEKPVEIKTWLVQERIKETFFG